MSATTAAVAARHLAHLIVELYVWLNKHPEGLDNIPKVWGIKKLVRGEAPNRIPPPGKHPNNFTSIPKVRTTSQRSGV